MAMNNNSDKEGRSSFLPRNFATSKKQIIESESETKRNSQKLHKRKNNHDINTTQNNGEIRPVKQHKNIEKGRSKDQEEPKTLEDVNSFQIALESIKQQIREGHQEANWKRIYLAYKAFDSLKCNESLWETYGRDLKVYQWPSQKSWKDTIGGHLFFPPETIDWESIAIESYHLRRIDNLWAFTIGAHFGHPLSKLYLVKTLDKIRSEYTDADQPDFFKKLYKESFQDLKNAADNPDACYVIGINYRCNPYSTAGYMNEKVDKVTLGCKNSIGWHEIGKDLKNTFGILKVKSNAKAIYDPPTADDYLALARAGYKPAYSEAAELTQDYKMKKKIRKEAIKEGYTIAWLGLGGMYKAKGNIDKARKNYTNAGEAGITAGYIRLGISYIGNVKNDLEMKKIPLKAHTEDDIKEGINAFRRAGKAGNPEGWEYLTQLYSLLHEEKLIPTKEFYHTITDSLCEGAWLGSASCYHKAYCLLPKSIFSFILMNYGMPPQHELRHVIEDFLNKKD